ncbi:hypothetical protein DENSPDRAFT_886875 [Dentipellis sp. KUC8613]|nr:hypothetical protein DENSPDRAFT_886875 [Dentipellis sp. KUC8613]
MPSRRLTPPRAVPCATAVTHPVPPLHVRGRSAPSRRRHTPTALALRGTALHPRPLDLPVTPLCRDTSPRHALTPCHAAWARAPQPPAPSHPLVPQGAASPPSCTPWHHDALPPRPLDPFGVFLRCAAPSGPSLIMPRYPLVPHGAVSCRSLAPHDAFSAPMLPSVALGYGLSWHAPCEF